jgi:exodeoxyribonuclease VII large subunit
MFHEENNLEIATACSVSELTRIITSLFQSIPILQDIWVFGEVSNLARPTSGHIYFTLKDQNASIKCVVWKSYMSKEASLLENGILIEAHGRIDVYPAAVHINYILIK